MDLRKNSPRPCIRDQDAPDSVRGGPSRCEQKDLRKNSPRPCIRDLDAPDPVRGGPSRSEQKDLRRNSPRHCIRDRGGPSRSEQEDLRKETAGPTWRRISSDTIIIRLFICSYINEYLMAGPTDAIAYGWSDTSPYA